MPKPLPSIVVDQKIALTLVRKEYRKALKMEYKLWETNPVQSAISDFEEALIESDTGGQPFPEHLATRLTEHRDSEEYCSINGTCRRKIYLMPKPYKSKIQINDVIVTSLILDIEEFNTLVDNLVGVFNTGDNTRLDPKQAVIIKHNMHIPMIGRGKKTQFIFDQYGIETNNLCVMVRGAADRIMKMAERNQAELN